MDVNGVLVFDGSNFLRQRICLSCLSGKPIRIRKIRVNQEEPGLKDYEVNFIRLIDSISNGTSIEVNSTGTVVKFSPGSLNGGKIEHTCSLSRGIGYYLQPLMMIAPFCRQSLNLTFRGVTNNKSDPTIDMIRLSLLPVLKKFLVIDDGLSLKMLSRGLPPKGGGVVHFSCPTRRELKAFQWEDSGKVKYIRGTAYTSRVAPAVGNRMLFAAKEVFKGYLQDVYLTVDNAKGASPGFGLCAVAETNKGSYYSAEAMSSNPSNDTLISENTLTTPEEVGKEAAHRLLNEIASGGCVDTMAQSLVLSFMVLGPKDISKVVMGMPTVYASHFLRHLKCFFNVTFKVDEYIQSKLMDDDEDLKLGGQKYIFTCMGIGYSNINKAIL